MIMSATGRAVPYCRVVSCRRFSGWASVLPSARIPAAPEHMNRPRFLGNQSLTSASTIWCVPSDHRSMKRDTAVYCGLPPEASGAPGGSWKSWILGVLLSMVVPLWKYKLGPLMQLKNEVETAVETAEKIAETVESVAEKVEHLADDIGNQLPEGGKLKEVADFVENVARETAKGAHLVDEAIEKVEEFGKKVEALGEDVEEVVDEIEDVQEVVDKQGAAKEADKEAAAKQK